MKKVLHPSLTLGAHRPYMSPEEALTTRIQMVLEGRPNQIPWRPEFGCDLTGLVGRAATPQRISEARFRVASSMRRWLPNTTLKDCTIQPVTSTGAVSTFRERSIPLAESALVSMGTEAKLSVELDIESELGALSVEATVEP